MRRLLWGTTGDVDVFGWRRRVGYAGHDVLRHQLVKLLESPRALFAERSDLRVGARSAQFEVSEGKRRPLGGYHHGVVGNLPHAIATEMAFAFRFTSQRLYELGFLNRVVDDDQLIPTAREMAEHLLSLPPASRVNTLMLMRAVRPHMPEDLEELGRRLSTWGAMSDMMESRRAFAEKRAQVWKGWDNPEDRRRAPTLESIRAERAARAEVAATPGGD